MQEQFAEVHVELQDQHTERRSELRLEMDTSVVFRTDFMPDFEEGLLLDLSKKGLSLFTVEPLAVGTQIYVLVESGYKDDELLLIRAETVRRESGDIVGYTSACQVHWHGTPSTSIDISSGALGTFVNAQIQYHGAERRAGERRQRPHERLSNLSHPGKWNRRSGRGRRDRESLGWC
ncbi:MAG: PilZ domain-containing protein [Gammaproteobacteria bacterium]|nr:PilZ domain-containing protein [Gammaproteobacteria bacterium]